jgi:hypothetical protein
VCTVLDQLRTEGLVSSVDVRIGHTELGPTFKLYVTEAVDVLGLGATLTHHARDLDPDSGASAFVDNATRWSERPGAKSVWNLLASQP